MLWWNRNAEKHTHRIDGAVSLLRWHGPVASGDNVGDGMIEVPVAFMWVLLIFSSFVGVVMSRDGLVEIVITACCLLMAVLAAFHLYGFYQWGVS